MVPMEVATCDRPEVALLDPRVSNPESLTWLMIDVDDHIPAIGKWSD